MRKTGFLMTAATAAVLLSAPMAQAQILGGGGGVTGGLGGSVGGLTGQAGGSLTGTGQIGSEHLRGATNGARQGIGDTVHATGDATRRTVKKGRSTTDAAVGMAIDTAGSASTNTSGAASAAGGVSNDGVSGAVTGTTSTGAGTGHGVVGGAGAVGVSGSAGRDGVGSSVNTGGATSAKPRH